MAESQLARARFGRSHMALDGIPVFVFHGLFHSWKPMVSLRGRKYWVRATRFEDYLKEIHRRGYRVQTLSELWNQLGRTGSPQRMHRQESSAVLTFDDGLASAYEFGYPLLQAAGLRSDFFVSTSMLGKPGFLNWSQIAEMQRSGMSFQSHSRDHMHLTRLGANELKMQLSDSKQTLEDRLGRSVEFLAAPYGDVDARVVELARDVGYRAVCGTHSRPVTTRIQPINRVAVYSHTTLAEFCRLLSGNPVSYLGRAAREMLIYVPKRVLMRLWPALPLLGYAPSGEAV